ncbi:MAG: guanine deaminase [Woeseia sp.]|jgi:guanine deaminase|nr:guanine deaminase [Woeseia sp.]
MSNERKETVILGTLVHAPVRGELEVIHDALVSVSANGEIVKIDKSGSTTYEQSLVAARKDPQLTTLKDGQYLLPGLVDLHIHAPQWPQLGKALDLPLYDWLQQCTFPLEAKYADLEFARPNYSSLVDNLIANGTTTATYFGTVHLEATKLLADICLAKGQRAVIGRVAMDNADECPDFYRDPTSTVALDETRAFIDYVRGLSGNSANRVMPAVTPRFIPSCTDTLLKGLGKIAHEYDCHIQTHCSESDWEHNYVLDRHGVNDTQSLDQFGLLTDKTILAHANLISDGDMSTIKQADCGIAHCPLSNIYFSNAVFPARRALDFGLNVGLGTDISGGPKADILSNCLGAVNASRSLEEGVDPVLAGSERGTADSRVSYLDAFWMATVGGAKSLGLKVGQLSLGYSFDAIVVDTTVANSNLMVWSDLDSDADILQKIVYNGGRNNIEKVWVQGRLLKGQ